MLPSIFGENLFDEFFDEPWEKSLFGARNPLYGKHAKNLMKTDVKETGDHYEVDIDLPGFQKDEISVELQNGYLTIQAAKGLGPEGPGGPLHPPGAVQRRLQPQLLCGRCAARGDQCQI